MKKLTVLFFVLLGVLTYADEINWVYSLDEALELAKNEDRQIMVDVYADWCGWCTKLDNETYRDETVIDMSKEFINLKIDSENNTADFQRLNDAFEIDSLPTILFLDNEGNYISEINGFVDVDGITDEMLYVLLFALFSEYDGTEENTINWGYDLLTALDTSYEENKLIMIDVYADWCTWCTKLDNETYSDPDIVELTKQFVNVKIDTENNADDFQALNEVFGITSIPVILFINSNGDLIHRIDGYVDVENFKSQVEQLAIPEPKEKIVWSYDLDNAMKVAGEENKLIMVDVYADWCGWCTRLDKDTYSNSEIVELTKQFVNLKIDSDNNTKDFEVLNKKFEITGLPAILFLDKNGELVHRIGGYVDAETFKKEIEKIGM